MSPPAPPLIQALFASDTIAVGWIDRDMRYLRVNERLARVNKLPVSEHVGKHIAEVVVGKVLDPLLSTLQKVVTAKVPHTEVLRGETMHVHTNYQPVFDEAGEVVSVLVLASDVTAQSHVEKQLEEQLREAASRLVYESLLTDFSTLLLRTPQSGLDEIIEVGVGSIGEVLDCVIVTLRLFDDNRQNLWPVHHWVSPQAENLQPIPPYSLEQMGWPREQLLRGDLVATTLDALPNEATFVRSAMLSTDVSMLVAVPLMLEGHFEGLLTLTWQRPPASLNDPLFIRLRMLGDTLASALWRARAEKALQELKAVAERERDYLREEMHARADVGSLSLGIDPETINAVAITDATVLILGETGVGKELLAHAIHEGSRRASAPLVKVNCAAIPPESFESEFFGHVKGAFAGAANDRVGRFELANGGTLFLDEVGELSPSIQAKLLRVLQEGEFERLGDGVTRRADVRVLAATHRDLSVEVASGRFRSDLYYRLTVFPLRVPPLRERLIELPTLAKTFLDRATRELDRPNLSLSAEDIQRLVGYAWPGNVRELQHVIERAVILSPKPPLRLGLALTGLAPERARAQAQEPVLLAPGDLRDLERKNILRALDLCDWTIGGPKGAATRLGVKPSTLRDRMKVLAITRPG